MDKKNYCVQNDGDCINCSLVNYGMDCRNNPIESGPIQIKKLSKNRYTLEMSRAMSMKCIGTENPDKSAYLVGYLKGLQYNYNPSSVSDKEHILWMGMTVSTDDKNKMMGEGYQAGLRAKPDPEMFCCNE